MSLWWLQPGWSDTRCAACGERIAPEGDPDWGYCYECFSARVARAREPEPEYHPPPCDICGVGQSAAAVNGYGVCSYECHVEAENRAAREEPR